LIFSLILLEQFAKCLEHEREHNKWYIQGSEIYKLFKLTKKFKEMWFKNYNSYPCVLKHICIFIKSMQAYFARHNTNSNTKPLT